MSAAKSGMAPGPGSRRIRRLGSCDRGAAAVEFALVAPIFLTMMCTIYNVGQMSYGQSVLDGAVQNAARNSTLEAGNTADADAKVEASVGRVLPGATIAASRVSYYDFTDIGRAEAWDDLDDNGTCNDSEPYTDENRNGGWDPDIGLAGNGGAGDVIIYEVSIEYTPSFSVPFAPANWNSTTLSSTTVKKNQPFAEQVAYGSGAGTCE